MEISRSLKQRISEYGIAEDKGVHLLTQMQAFAPHDARAFLAEQLEDEKRHARLFEQRAHELNITEPFFLDELKGLYELAQRHVDRHNWVACMVMQSVIEELAMASFGQLYRDADPATRTMLESIMEDENKHLEFTLEQLHTHVQTDADRAEVDAVHQEILALFMNALQTVELQADFLNGLKQAYLLHKKRFQIIGLKVPNPV